VRNIGLGFDASPLFGIGIGYYYNDWLRFDLTGEYRSRANFHGTQIIRSGGSTYTDEYSGSKSEAYPVDSGSPTCSVMNGCNRAATRARFDGRCSFACPIPEGLC